MRQLLVVVLVLVASITLWLAYGSRTEHSSQIESSISKDSVKVRNTKKSKKTIEKSLIDFKKILIAVNAERSKKEIPNLLPDSRLMLAAKARLFDMVDREYFEHVSPLGKQASDFVAEQGYNYFFIAENLAKGRYQTAEEIVADWLKSESHRKPILSKAYSQTGLAVEENNSNIIAVEIFGVPKSACSIEPGKIAEEIKKNNQIIDRIGSELELFDREIDAIQPGPSEDLERVRSEFHALTLLNQDLEEKYKSDSKAYNECVQALKLELEAED